MSDKSGVTSQVITLPSGGGALQGIGESFSPDLFTGTGNFAVPISLLPGRNGFQPTLGLSYSTGQGNGPFGLGWDLAIPGITRKTSKGVPLYGEYSLSHIESDTFVLGGGDDLVLLGVEQDGVSRFRPRTESLFARVQRIRVGENDYWTVESKDGFISTYGTPESAMRDRATIANPKSTGQLFAWCISETRDRFGNTIVYEYDRDADGDPDYPWNQIYLRKVSYNSLLDNGQRNFLVSVSFDYEDRPDPFSSYRAGFEIRTRKRCARIAIHTHAGVDRLVRSYDLEYVDTRVRDGGLPADRIPTNGLSLLSLITVTGHDEGLTERLPPLELDYTTFSISKRRYQAFGAVGNAMPNRSLADPDFEMVDLFGRGLPDIVEMSGRAVFWRNLGAGRFDEPLAMEEVPASARLQDPGVRFVDLNGNGASDLLVPQLGGYYPLSFKGRWSEVGFVQYSAMPRFDMSASDWRFVDLDGDGVTDALETGTSLNCYFNDAVRGWERVEAVARADVEGFGEKRFADGRLKLADLNGDDLQDLVYVQQGSIEYWPSLGHGRWARSILMENSPRIDDPSAPVGEGFDPQRLFFGDVDGDGLDDIIYVQPGRVTIWINQSGRRWSDPILIDDIDLPLIQQANALRLVDMLGQGMPGLLWTFDIPAPGDSNYRFLDLTNGLKPYLLAKITNHCGAVTKVSYASSTKFYLADFDDPVRRWQLPLPFPVHVVERVTVQDQLSKSTLVTEHRYHRGYWDGVEREFRGFGMVEQLDSESFEAYKGGSAFDRQYFSAPTRRKTWFHLGPIGDNWNDWEENDWSAEYWPGDPHLLRHVEGVNRILSTLPVGRARRDALRSLRGSILRTELFAEDGAENQDRPYTVAEFAYGLREEASPDASEAERPRIFFPHRVADRTTQWERGPDPMTQFSFAADFDEYGQQRKQTRIACPRGWRRMEDRPVASGPGELRQETYLATRTITTYGEPTDPGIYIHDREVRTTSLELTATAGRRVQDLADLDDSDSSLRIFWQTVSFYDGDAFEGLPWKNIGEHGASVRTESLVLSDGILSAAYDPRPPFFTGSPIPWTADYPETFRLSIRPLAGYVRRTTPPYAEGLFEITSRRQYDFQDPSVAPHYGLVTVMRDALDRDTRIGYDEYKCLPAEVSDPIGMRTTATYDYRILRPNQVVDANGNSTLFSFTPLGLLNKTWIRGKGGKGDQLLPSVVMFYDFGAYYHDGQPVSVSTTRRVHHDTDFDVALPNRDETITAIDYSDGFGRLLQTRTQAEDVRFGDPLYGSDVVPQKQRDPSTDKDVVRVPNRDNGLPNVVVSGWQRYDNKGHVVERFEPFFAEGWNYVASDVDPFGTKVTMFYDPRGQVIRTVGSDLSEQRVLFGIPMDCDDPPLGPLDIGKLTPTPWETYTYDANDNAGRTHGTTAKLYEHHWNTPSSISIDALGRTVRSVERNRGPRSDNASALSPLIEYQSRFRYDIRGNLLNVVDTLNRPASTYIYDFANKPLRVANIDGGVRASVFDALGNIIEQRDSKGALDLCEYDGLNRLRFAWARNGDTESVTLREVLEYGDASDANQDPTERTANAAQDRLGRLHLHYDQAGLQTIEAYDFKGNVTERERRVVTSSAIEAAMNAAGAATARAFRMDWQPPIGMSLPEHGKSLIEYVGHQTSVTCDALNRTKELRYPRDVAGERRLLRSHYNRAGALFGITLGQDTYISHIAYNAKGQRILVAYGNGVMTRYAYDHDTFRLSRMRTERFTSPTDYSYRPSGEVFQDLAYGYDLVGNILRITDAIGGCGVRNNPESALFPDWQSELGAGNALIRRFEYDPLYRLTSASGREANNTPNPRSNEDLARDGFNGFGWTGSGTTAPENAKDETQIYSESYEYDPAGNMMRLNHNGGWSRNFGIAGFTPAQWRAKIAQFLAGAEPDFGAQGNRLTNIGSENVGTTHAFDGDGNLKKEFTNRHFTWDHADRLISFVDQAEGSSQSTCEAAYLYDASGTRTVKWVRRGTKISSTVYVDGIFEYRIEGMLTNNSLHIINESDRIAVVRIGQPLAGDQGPVVQYHLRDHLGSNSTVLGGEAANSALFVNREEYFPFGETSFGSFGRKRYRFTGKERDEESGLSYHGGRYFSASLHRWISCDCSREQPQESLYEYCGLNPIRRIDLDGADGIDAIKEFFGINKADRAIDIALASDDADIGAAFRQRAVGVAGAGEFLSATGEVVMMGVPAPGGGASKTESVASKLVSSRQLKKTAEADLIRSETSGGRVAVSDGLTANGNIRGKWRSVIDPIVEKVRRVFKGDAALREELAALRSGALSELPQAGKGGKTLAMLVIGEKKYTGWSVVAARELEGVNPVTLRHAEGDVFDQALREGASSKDAILVIDHPGGFCSNCAASNGVIEAARQVGVENLKVITPDTSYMIRITP